jgi:hypothetical protein
MPDIAGLTKQVNDALAKNEKLAEVTKLAWERVNDRGIKAPTVEHLLSHIRMLTALCGTGSIDGFTKDQLSDLDRAICKHIREIVSLPLPTSDTPYHILASWIQAIPREYPVEIFTTNYDLLLEQALEEQRVPYFDGFVGFDSAFLDLESMARDDLPARWTRLWKIHGSISWWLTDKKIRRSRDEPKAGEEAREQLLIYPSHLKYDQSRQMPYYAMLDRLRVFLGSDDRSSERSNQCILLTCGYSFADEHINACIGQGLSGNPNAACLGMIFKDRSEAPEAVELAKRYANLTLLAADGGIVGTVDGDWHEDESKNVNPAHPIAVGRDLPDWRTKAPKTRCKWLLGDFEAFGKFLAHQLSSRNLEPGAHDAR